jgi:cyclin-dependent kinase 8/11
MEVSTSWSAFVNSLNHASSFVSAFETVPVHQFPPHRRITQDEAPSMMPLPAQNTSHQGAANAGAGGHNGGGHVAGPFGQPHSKPGSTTSFTSGVSGGYAGQTTATGGNGHSRKKARLG